MSDRKIIYLLNPKANENHARDSWRKLQARYKILPKEPVNILDIGDLANFIQHENPSLVVAVGGDGTVNRICGALVSLEKKPDMALLPLGYGNALSYCLGVETAEKAMRVIKNPHKKVTIDLFSTTIPEIPIGVFSMGVGFDGQIVHARMHHRYIGLRSYALAVIRSYFAHVTKRLKFTIDYNVTMTSTASALSISNAPTIGKNFVLSENAKINDGYLDCTLFSSHYAYLTNMRIKGFKHPLYSEYNKVHFLAKHIKIEGDQYAQVDGDPAIHIKPIEISILPGQVTFLRNDDEEIELPTLPFV